MSAFKNAAKELCRLRGESPDVEIILGEGYGGNHESCSRCELYRGHLQSDYQKLKALMSVPEIRADFFSENTEDSRAEGVG